MTCRGRRSTLFGSLGLSSSPEGAATLAGLRRLRDDGWIGPRDEVVVFNTAGATRYRPWTPPVPVATVASYADYRSREREVGRSLAPA